MAKDKRIVDLVIEKNETVEVNIKESRKIRGDKLIKKQRFHKENPKSIEYYKSNPPKSEDAVIVKKDKTKNDLNIKSKSQIQMMFNNLTKSYRKKGVFINSNKQLNKIQVLKDYNVSVYTLNNKKHTIGVRCEIGTWGGFLDTVKSNTRDYAYLSRSFDEWLNKQIIGFDAQQGVQDFFDSVLLSNQEIDDSVRRYLPKLEELLLKNLRKPGKQPLGFRAKGLVVYNQWLERTREVDYIEKIESKLNFKSYEQTFELARRIKRKFSIFIGPTNSGKTHAALDELKKVRSGVYLAPLRLMASEGQEALFERGVLANLVTGEEKSLLENATHTSSTIEMLDLSKVVDAAVIDEIQMIGDKSRGWAWSQALIGVPAHHVVLVGSQEALPFIIPVIENLGEEYEIKTFERKAPLVYREPLQKIKDLKPGDCVVVFSRKNALEMKNTIESYNKKCSIIYGNLSPEVRRLEAQKFKQGVNDILVATDAIGMGLNLPINRLFFSTLQKFDGEDSRLLTVSEIKQIAGRSGRYGLTQTGEVGLLADNSVERNELLKRSIYLGYEKAADVRVSIAPNLNQIEIICDVIGRRDLYAALIFFKEKLIKNHDLYKTANLDSMVDIAALLKSKNLDIKTGLTYSCVPIDVGNEKHVRIIGQWITDHLKGKVVNVPEIPDVVAHGKTDSFSLFEAENYVKLCMVYRWLHYKFPDIYPFFATAEKNSDSTNRFIERSLHQHIVMSKMPRKFKR